MPNGRSTPGTRGSGTPAHVPVMLKEVLQVLHLETGLTVVDGTVGAAGHSREILRKIGPTGMLIGLDRDALMLDIAAHQLSGSSCHLVQASYAELPQVLARLAVSPVDRILLDLGLSSDQLADESRGFSFSSDGPLDLRFDASCGEPASDLLARLSEDEIAGIFHRYGEEPDARRFARNLVAFRARQPIHTASDLASAIGGPGGKRSQRSTSMRRGRHPATRVFQALRIVVNNELEQLESALQGGLRQCLKVGGIVAVISFHSLEDRLVKQAFRESKSWQTLSPNLITASPAEQRFNPRSRSAKLRAARKLPAQPSS